MSNNWTFPDDDEPMGLDGLSRVQPSGPPPQGRRAPPPAEPPDGSTPTAPVDREAVSFGTDGEGSAKASTKEDFAAEAAKMCAEFARRAPAPAVEPQIIAAVKRDTPSMA